jgi:hypothetical protein
MTSLAWKLNRLRTMGLREVAWRLRQAAAVQAERWGLGRLRVPAAARAPAGPSRPWVAPLPQAFDVAVYRKAADRVLQGRFDVFALQDLPLGFPPDWHRDPKTGTRAPASFGKTMDYRDERVVGDIKYLWEPNRHAELVTLAQAWHLCRDERYAQGCVTLLQSWFQQCPYPLGPNWTSSLEHAVRLVNWSVAWRLLDGAAIFEGAQGEDFRKRWLDAVYLHLGFVAGHLSRHSSANNHLLGELMGVFIGTACWPLWPECARWHAQAAREFQREALLQNSPDGVNREQATWYHHEVADMMLLVGLHARAQGEEFEPAYWQRLESMLEFIAAVMDCGGHVPMIGDADDARMVRFDPRPQADVYRSLLATGAVLFGRGDFKAKAPHFDDKSRWLLGDEAEQRFEQLPLPAEELPRRVFREGGYWVLGQDFGTPSEVRLVVDAGPLGYLGIAAHGHADALAFTLSVAGHPVLIDPGTYAYHTQKKWRDYFRGTSAHNTLRVDGLDQSQIAGNFMWLQHADASLESFDLTPEAQRWVGKHDGYRRLSDPVGHQREIVLLSSQREIVVTDTVTCAATHTVELFWHLHPACEVSTAADVFRVALHGQDVLHIHRPTGLVDLSVACCSGQEEPPLGWYSQRFDEKQPCTTLVFKGQLTGTGHLVTRMTLPPPNRAGTGRPAQRGVDTPCT